jgi:hypothetical protein
MSNQSPPTNQSALSNRERPGDDSKRVNEGGVMAKRYGRPSLQYRYEHYDPC